MLQNFLGFDGRIGRQSWWIGTIILVIVSIVLYFLLSAVMGTSFADMMDPAKMNDPAFLESYMRSNAMQQLISLVILGYPVVALMGKRLNDRDRPSWMKWLFIAPSVLAALLGLLGLDYSMADAGGGIMMPLPTTLGWLSSAFLIVVGIWALIELGFLRGTDGQNQYGPDPIAD
jgi:uncharacterized membrane protein YhaH (DUF805 family)